MDDAVQISGAAPAIMNHDEMQSCECCEPISADSPVDGCVDTNVGTGDRSADVPALTLRAGAVEESPVQIVEALLFSSDAPISAGRLAELVGCGTAKTVRDLVAELNARYEQAGLSFRIEEIARGFQMLTLPAYRPWLTKLTKQTAETRLSDAALETLAVIAYKQPVIRADIEAIRGVACGDVCNRLREMGLIRVVGRAEVVGRPMLFGTTKRFLDVFGLADLDELPPLESLKLRPSSVVEEPPVEDEPAVRSAAGA